MFKFLAPFWPQRRRGAECRRHSFASRRLRGTSQQLWLESLEVRHLLAVIVDLAELQPSDGVVLTSGVIQDMPGFSVSRAGDVNADGFDDFLVGAPVLIGFPAGAGEAYLVLGRGSDWPTAIDLRNQPAGTGVTFRGIFHGDHAGFAVGHAGDVNGDGLHDLLIGAPYADLFGSGGQISGVGEAYLVLGDSSLPPLDTLNGDNGVRLRGHAPQARAGFSVATAGDLNGDGYDDVIVGAPVDLDHTIGTGQAYVVYGRASGFANELLLGLLSGVDGFALLGLGLEDHAGFSARGVGDLNGDGFADVAIGAPFADGAGVVGTGETYIVFGGFAQPPGLHQLDGSNGFRVDGATAFERSGFSVSGAGDVNGDGFDDLLIGAPADENIPTHAGKAFVVFGKASGFAASMQVANLNGTNGFEIRGIDGVADGNGTDHAGFSVSAAGDVNGDGLDDLILGAPFRDRAVGETTFFGSGEAYLLFGRRTAFPSQVSLAGLADSEGVVFRGDQPFDRTGFSVSGAGDVNGDGFDDLLIGAPVDVRFVSRTSHAYLVFGRDFTDNQPTTGGPLADVLTGDPGANTVLGGLGNDTLVGAGGADVLIGAEGNDVLRVSDAAFSRLDGGGGHDTLVMDGPGFHLDLTAIPDNRVWGIEQIDLAGSGDHTLTIGNVREVFRLSDSSNRLIVERDAEDSVNLGSGWTQEGIVQLNGQAFHRYRQGAAELFLVDLPPAVDLNGPQPGTGFPSVYVEDSPPVKISAPDLRVDDEATIVSATVRLTNPADGADESIGVTPAPGIQAAYDTETALLTLTGSGTPAAYAEVLRTLTYLNTSQHPSTVDRSIEVVVHDGRLASPPATATVSVVPANDAPVLNPTMPGHLADILEDSEPEGQTVESFVAADAIFDPDGSAAESIAVVALDSALGTWQYALAGGAWRDFGTPSTAAARLLASQDRVRLLPHPDAHGTSSLRFRAWDESSGTAGETADVTTSGGATAFSVGEGSATIQVIPVNDAPVLDTEVTPQLTPVYRNSRNSPGDPISAVVVNGSITDVDGFATESIAVIGTEDANGVWEYALDGTSWSVITATETAALLLGPSHRLRFTPALEFFGVATLNFRAWDRSAGIDGGLADTTASGGTSAFSTATATAEIVVMQADALPTLDPIASPVVLASGSSQHLVLLSGISDGGSDTESLIVSASSDSPAVLPAPEVNYVSPSPTGSMTLLPISDAAGWAVVTVTVEEADGDGVTRRLAVSVGANPKIWQNPLNRFDTSGDGVVVPFDVLVIINEVNDPSYRDPFGRLPLPPSAGVPPPFLDVNGDGFATSNDALQLINLLNQPPQAEGESEGGPAGGRSSTPLVLQPASLPGHRRATRAREMHSPPDVVPPVQSGADIPHLARDRRQRDVIFRRWPRDSDTHELEGALEALDLAELVILWRS